MRPRPILDPPPAQVPTTRDPLWARAVDAALRLAWPALELETLEGPDLPGHRRQLLVPTAGPLV